MYKRVCPDIFKNYNDAITSVNKIEGLPDDPKEFIGDFLTMNSDLNWVLLALAKGKVLQPELIDIAIQKLKEIEEQDSIFTMSPTVTDYLPMYYMFAYTLLTGLKDYAHKCLSEEGDTNLYHPYGAYPYITILLKVAYDCISFSAKEEAEYGKIIVYFSNALEQNIIPVSDVEYQTNVLFRFDLFKESDSFLPSIKSMFESSMSIKEFKDKLGLLVSAGIVDMFDVTNGRSSEVVEMLDRHMNRAKPSNNGTVPQDIEGMFDD